MTAKITDLGSRAFKTFVQVFGATFLTMITTAFSGDTSFDAVKNSCISLIVACVGAGASAVWTLIVNKYVMVGADATSTTALSVLLDTVNRYGKTFIVAVGATFLTLIGTAFANVTDFGTLKTAAVTLVVGCLAAGFSAVWNSFEGSLNVAQSIEASK